MLSEQQQQSASRRQINRYLIQAGVLLLGTIIAFFIAMQVAADPYFTDGRINQIIIPAFLGCWLIASSLIVHSAKWTYWCLQAAIWMTGAGIAFYIVAISKADSRWSLLWLWLLLPLGISALFLLLYKPFVAALSRLHLFRLAKH